VATAGTASEDQLRDLRSAALVAKSVIEQVYFASGAAEDKKQFESTELTQTDLERFARLALPLLEGYGDIQHPAVTHHIIETIDRISDAQPRRALLAAARAATTDGAYTQEQLALDAVLRLVKRYVADHRDLVLGDIECTNAVRMLLESFVRVGWDKAVQFAESMDDIFR
jgi:hypothetical protein